MQPQAVMMYRHFLLVSFPFVNARSVSFFVQSLLSSYYHQQHCMDGSEHTCFRCKLQTMLQWFQSGKVNLERTFHPRGTVGHIPILFYSDILHFLGCKASPHSCMLEGQQLRTVMVAQKYQSFFSLNNSCKYYMYVIYFVIFLVFIRTINYH